MRNPYILVTDRYAEGGVSDKSRLVRLREALITKWPFDAHFAQYTSGERRLKKTLEKASLFMRVAAFDFDCPNHESIDLHGDMLDALDRLPDGAVAYLTHGGFRVISVLPKPRSVDSPEAWEDWRAYHTGLGRELSDILGVPFDPACSDPGRLFRLPNVKRPGGKRVYPDLIGELGTLSWEPTPVAPRAATPVSTGEARKTLLGAAFADLGAIQDEESEKLTVTCLWAHEHSAGQDDKAVVYSTEDGLGKYHCGHTHCIGRGTEEALDVLEHMPKTSGLIKRWMTIVEEKEGKVAKANMFQCGADLAAPIPPVAWLVKDLDLCPGRPPLLVANSGVGKSWALQSLALSVASGKPVFGAFPCRQGPVLHVSRDSPERATQRRYQQLAAGLDIDLHELPIKVFSQPLPCVRRRVFDPEAFDTLREEVARGGYALVILDSVTSITCGLDENSPEIAAPLYATRDDSCVWLWAHHTPKGGAGPRGSGALRGAAGAVWEVSRAKGAVRNWVLDKSSEEPDGVERNSFSTQWLPGENGAAQIILAQEDLKTSEERPADRIKREIFAALEAGRSSKKAILEKVGGKNAMKREVFDYLVYVGSIDSAGPRYVLGQTRVGALPERVHEAGRRVFSKTKAVIEDE